MRPSLYLKLATWLIQADIKHEERKWQQRVEQSARRIPWHNSFMLRDMGLAEGQTPRLVRQTNRQVADRRMRHLRRLASSRIPT